MYNTEWTSRSNLPAHHHRRLRSSPQCVQTLRSSFSYHDTRRPPCRRTCAACWPGTWGYWVDAQACRTRRSHAPTPRTWASPPAPPTTPCPDFSFSCLPPARPCSPARGGSRRSEAESDTKDTGRYYYFSCCCYGMAASICRRRKTAAGRRGVGSRGGVGSLRELLPIYAVPLVAGPSKTKYTVKSINVST